MQMTSCHGNFLESTIITNDGRVEEGPQSNTGHAMARWPAVRCKEDTVSGQRQA